MCELKQRSGCIRKFGSWLKSHGKLQNLTNPWSLLVKSIEVSGSMSPFVVKWSVPMCSTPGSREFQHIQNLAWLLPPSEMRLAEVVWWVTLLPSVFLLHFNKHTEDGHRPLSAYARPDSVPAALPALFQCHSCHKCMNMFNKEAKWEKQTLHGPAYVWTLKENSKLQEIESRRMTARGWRVGKNGRGS